MNSSTFQSYSKISFHHTYYYCCTASQSAGQTHLRIHGNSATTHVSHSTINTFSQPQAPKSLPPIAKQNLILTYLHKSRTAHSIKELEKALPSVASINGMQVKDYLQALSDEGRVRVEKIGSGNWYWSFISEEKRSRDSVLEKLKDELLKVEGSLEDLEEKVREASGKRGEDDEGRGGLVSAKLELDGEVRVLKKELEGYKDGDPGEVERRRKEIKALQARAETWTDNIGILEGHMLGLLGGSREGLDEMKREVYGDEYVEGEGLKEM